MKLELVKAPSDWLQKKMEPMMRKFNLIIPRDKRRNESGDAR